MPAEVDAQRTSYLIQALSTSDSFRVRVQAAISLGRRQDDEGALRALMSCFDDEHPAVRIACAASLEGLRNPEALPALRRAARDRDRGARRAIQSAIRTLERVERDGGGDEPSGPAQYYVGIGSFGNPAGASRSVVEAAQEMLRQSVSSINGVVFAPNRESPRAARRVLQRRNLKGVFLDASITSVEETSRGTRVAVSIVVNTYPGRDIRAMLEGAATAPGAASDASTRRALDAAIQSALRQLPRVMSTIR